MTAEIEDQLHRCMQLLFHRKMLLGARLGAVRDVIANEAPFYARDFGIPTTAEQTTSTNVAGFGAGVVDRKRWASSDAAARAALPGVAFDAGPSG